MDKAVLFSLCFAISLAGCSSISPEQRRDDAFAKYSLDCVARGLPEDTPEHTKCVMDKYEAYQREQKRSEQEMAKLYGDDDAAKADKQQDSDSASDTSNE